MPTREIVSRALFWERHRLRIMEERYVQEGDERVLLSIVWTRRRIEKLQRQLKELDTFQG